VPFSARLTCRFWSAEIGICSRQPQYEPGRFHRYKQWNRFNRQNRTSPQIPRRGDTPRRALQTTRRCALERLTSAIFCLLTLPILECRNRTLQQTSTARSWPLPPLQRLEPLQPPKSNLDANPPQRGHSPDGPCKLRGGVLWSDLGVPFPACLTCRFWSAEIGLCSGQPQHEPGRFSRYKV